MIDILEAPVPLLVGLSDSYLHNTPPANRPKSVVFVHLDENKIYFENTEDQLLEKISMHPLPVPSLPYSFIDSYSSILKLLFYTYLHIIILNDLFVGRRNRWRS